MGIFCANVAAARCHLAADMQLSHVKTQYEIVKFGFLNFALGITIEMTVLLEDIFDNRPHCYELWMCL